MAKRILLIESDMALAGSIASALQARGAEVSLARDGTSALDVARGERPDGIVLCAELPGGSGFVVCNKLRKDPELREIPLLLTSADASEETFEQHRKLRTRADAYLRKPFAVSALLSQLAPLTGLAASTPAAPDDEDLLAFDAAFDSIAQVDEAGAPIDRPISSDEVDAAAALVADLPDVEDLASPPAATPVAVVAPTGAADPAELARLRAELDLLRTQLAQANAAREELSRQLAAEQERARGAGAANEQLSAERARIRSVLATALSELDRP